MKSMEPQVVTSDVCGKCDTPVSDAARFCLRCGARVERHPSNSFRILTLIFFVLVGVLLSSSFLIRTSGPRHIAAEKPIDQDARLISDSYCSESKTQVLELYALIAQGDRDSATAVVL